MSEEGTPTEPDWLVRPPTGSEHRSGARVVREPQGRRSGTVSIGIHPMAAEAPA